MFKNKFHYVFIPSYALVNHWKKLQPAPSITNMVTNNVDMIKWHSSDFQNYKQLKEKIEFEYVI